MASSMITSSQSRELTTNVSSVETLFFLTWGNWISILRRTDTPQKNSEYIKQYCEEDKKGSKRKVKRPLSEPESKVVKITNPTVSVAVTVSDGPKLEGKQLE